MSRRAPPQKKRHTKPCKFFQVNRCPHPADVCNFAHVIASPSDRGSSMYHDYPGYYAHDVLCKYSYGSRVPLLKPLDIPSTSADSLRVDTKNLGKAYLDRDIRLIADVPFIRSLASPFSQKTAAESPPFTPSPESITTSSTSMSTLDLDDVAIVTDDPQYHEHLHSYQSQVYVVDDSPMIHVPPFSPYHQLTFNGPHTPSYSYENSNMSGKPLDLFKPSNSTRSSTKQKILKYKTKPCRFFPTERGCPKGGLCSFIHDELQHRIPSTVEESSLKEENNRKNYFPVPWRVIGGGVRVGIKTEDSNLYSTVNSSRPVDSDSKLGNDAPSTKFTPRKRSNSDPPTPSPHSLQFKVEHLFSAESPGVL